MPCLVHVEPETGAERLGNPPGPDDESWLARWWPLDEAEPGARAEIGRERDSAWADAVRRVRRGVLVAIDYWHRRGDRPPAGTLAAYRAGRMVPPVPDGSCDITAHVALDSCASAGDEAGATATLLTTQRQALRALGVDASLPPRTLALDDSQAYLAALSQTTQAVELLDPAGLGAFGWLVQTVNRRCRTSWRGWTGQPIAASFVGPGDIHCSGTSAFRANRDRSAWSSTSCRAWLRSMPDGGVDRPRRGVDVDRGQSEPSLHGSLSQPNTLRLRMWNDGKRPEEDPSRTMITWSFAPKARRRQPTGRSHAARRGAGSRGTPAGSAPAKARRSTSTASAYVAREQRRAATAIHA